MISKVIDLENEVNEAKATHNSLLRERTRLERAWKQVEIKLIRASDRLRASESRLWLCRHGVTMDKLTRFGERYMPGHFSLSKLQESIRSAPQGQLGEFTIFGNRVYTTEEIMTAADLIDLEHEGRPRPQYIPGW